MCGAVVVCSEWCSVRCSEWCTEWCSVVKWVGLILLERLVIIAGIGEVVTPELGSA